MGVHREDEDRRLVLRGDKLGFRHIGEMSTSRSVARVAQGGDDGGVYHRKHDRSRFSGRGRGEHLDEEQRGWHRVKQHYGTRSRIWACRIQQPGPTRVDGMRSNRMGVRDLGQVPCVGWDAGHSAGDDDGGRARREHYGSMVHGSQRDERGSQIELRRHRIPVLCGSRIFCWICGDERCCQTRALWMREYFVGVGINGKVSRRKSFCCWDQTSCGDGRSRYVRKLDI